MFANYLRRCRMLEHKEHFHGSDLEKIEKIFGIKKETITSFSANVNPLGVSSLLRESLSSHIDAITGYPDREYTSLRRAIADYAGCDYENILVGNGSTELISIFIQIHHPKKAMMIAPTYSEYEREITLEGGECVCYPLKEENNFVLDIENFTEQLTDDLDLLIICNPNNPTSGAIRNDDMRRILDACLQHGIFVMTDETYVEFAPDYKAVSSVPLTGNYDNLIILRGTSKFFAAPGLRLGYAITGNRRLIETINSRKNPWTINSLAVVAGEIMFKDTDYMEQTRSLISSERDKMYQAFLNDPRFKAYEPSANFLLVKILDPDLDADYLFEKAIRQGMMIRNCSTFQYLSNKFFRVCFMSPEMNDKLLKCLLEK